MATLNIVGNPPGDQVGVTIATKLDGYTIKWAAQELGELVQVWQNTTNNRNTATLVATVADTYYDSPTLAVGVTYFVWTRRVSQFGVPGNWDLGVSAGRSVNVVGVSNNVVNFAQLDQDFVINCLDFTANTAGKIEFNTAGTLTFNTAGQITFNTAGTLTSEFEGEMLFFGDGNLSIENRPTGTLNLDLSNMNGKILVSNATAGATGAVTQNTHSGQVDAAAGTTSLVVTNNKITTSSRVMAIAATNDSTGRVTAVVPAAGSFTIRYVAPTANMKINWFVVN